MRRLAPKGQAAIIKRRTKDLIRPKLKQDQPLSLTSSNSRVNTSVEFGGIRSPAPLAP